MGWVSWPLYIFMFLASFSALWWPNIWPKMGFPELFEKTIGSIHFLPGIYPYGVSFLTLNIFVLLASFSALWWSNIWPKMGFPELFEKTIGSIHFLPGIYPYGVSFLTLNIFVLLASFSALWWPNIWPKMVFPELFEKTIGSIHFLPGIYPYGASLLTPIHFCAQFISILYWIFLDGVGSDQSGGILSPFMGTACCYSFLLLIISTIFVYLKWRVWSRKISRRFGSWLISP